MAVLAVKCEDLQTMSGGVPTPLKLREERNESRGRRGKEGVSQHDWIFRLFTPTNPSEDERRPIQRLLPCQRSKQLEPKNQHCYLQMRPRDVPASRDGQPRRPL